MFIVSSFCEESYSLFLLSHLVIVCNWKIKLNDAWWYFNISCTVHRFKCKEMGLASFHMNNGQRSLILSKIQGIFIFSKNCVKFSFPLDPGIFGLGRLHHWFGEFRRGSWLRLLYPEAYWRATSRHFAGTWGACWERLTQFLPLDLQIFCLSPVQLAGWSSLL